MSQYDITRPRWVDSMRHSMAIIRDWITMKMLNMSLHHGLGVGLWYILILSCPISRYVNEWHLAFVWTSAIVSMHDIKFELDKITCKPLCAQIELPKIGLDMLKLKQNDYHFITAMSNERQDILRHLHFNCLFSSLFKHTSKKTSTICVNGLCEGNLPVTGGSPHKGPVM